MIKVIASDMDGTLLGDDHRIAPETLAAVQEACAAGLRFMICTGRNFPGAMQELEAVSYTHLDVYKRQMQYFVKKSL